MSFFEPGPTPHPYRRILGVIWLVAAGLVALVAWHVITLTQNDHLRRIASTERDLANLTRVSQEHAGRTLRSADQVVRFVQARYLELGNALDQTALTEQGVIDSEIFNQVGIIDAQGMYALANRPLTGKLDLSDREHFRVHVGADTGELFVSKPVVGRATGKWSVQLTRRINHPDGSFAGVVVLSVDPRYFTQFYGELQLGDRGMMALYGLDGLGRARRVGNQEAFGVDASKSPLFERLAQGQTEGAYTRRSEVDGVERLHYFRRIPNYPLVVVAALDTQEMLTNHYRTRDDLRLQGVLLALLIVALAAALTRFLLNIHRAMQARAAAQRQAQERTEQRDAIFALSPDGFISFDQHLRITYVSPAFYQLTDAGALKLEGLHEKDLSAWLTVRRAPGSAVLDLAALRAQMTPDQPDVRQNIEVLAPARRVLEVGLRRKRSGLVSQILSFRDVTAALEVDAMKSEFLATAAHELRTPMTSILGFTEILLTHEHDVPTQREFLSIVLSQSQLMAKILDELLDLARIEARRGKDFRYKPVPIPALVAEVVKSLPVPPERLAPRISLPEDTLEVMADASKLKQALTNVLTNAYKYSSARADNVVAVDVVTATSTHGVAQVGIRVSDTGLGMTPEQTHKMFERFYRADTSGSVPGTGLGMSIVKEIIDLHQGEIRVDSVLGQGTCVTLYLPICTGHN